MTEVYDDIILYSYKYEEMLFIWVYYLSIVHSEDWTMHNDSFKYYLASNYTLEHKKNDENQWFNIRIKLLITSLRFCLTQTGYKNDRKCFLKFIYTLLIIII